MIKQSLPAVQFPETFEELDTLIDAQTKPFVLQINPTEDGNATFNKVANQKRKVTSLLMLKINKLSKI